MNTGNQADAQQADAPDVSTHGRAWFDAGAPSAHELWFDPETMAYASDEPESCEACGNLMPFCICEPASLQWDFGINRAGDGGRVVNFR